MPYSDPAVRRAADRARKARKYASVGPRDCLLCRVPFQPRGPQVYCSLRCRHKANYQNRGRAWRHEHQSRVNELQRRRLRLRDAFERRIPYFNSYHKENLTSGQLRMLMVEQCGRCPLCDVSLSGGWEIDHIVSLRMGGGSDIGNLQLLCRACNIGKWTFTVNEYVSHCRAVVRRARKASIPQGDLSKARRGDV